MSDQAIIAPRNSSTGLPFRCLGALLVALGMFAPLLHPLVDGDHLNSASTLRESWKGRCTSEASRSSGTFERFDPDQVAAAGRKRLERSSFMGYLASASQITETHPELMGSVCGLGPLLDEPVASTFSPICLIEDYEGTVPSLPREKSLSEGWVQDLLQSLRGWLYTTQAALDLTNQVLLYQPILQIYEDQPPLSKLDEESFWSEWEWVLSHAEEIAITQSLQRAQQIETELKNLRRTANHLKQRPFFVSHAKSVLSGGHSVSSEGTSSSHTRLTPTEHLQLLHTHPLDSSLRSKLLRDVVDQFSSTWLAFIGELFFQSGSSSIEPLPLASLPAEPAREANFAIFIENYAERPYAKNLTGALIAMGFVASHGSEQCLTPQVLGDILWSWWSTLMRAIREILGVVEVEEAHAMLLAEKIIGCAPVIARLWLETVQHSRKSAHVQGTLPELWRQREREEEARLHQLRATGLIDAKYRDGPAISPSHSTMSPARLAEVKARLEERFFSG